MMTNELRKSLQLTVFAPRRAVFIEQAMRPSRSSFAPQVVLDEAVQGHPDTPPPREESALFGDWHIDCYGESTMHTMNNLLRSIPHHLVLAFSVALASSSSLGCSGSGSDVSGKWCGSDVKSAEECKGDEVVYVELTQSGSEVTGTSCEEYKEDCLPLEGGAVDGDTLTFHYSFSEFRVDGELTLDGDTLTGSLNSTKCDCSIPLTLHRL